MVRWRRLPTALVAVLLLAPAASAKPGHRLSFITPNPSGNGRGLELRPGTSIEYYTFEGIHNPIDEINLWTGRHVSQLTTDLKQVCHCSSTSDFGFGGLSRQRPT